MALFEVGKSDMYSDHVHRISEPSALCIYSAHIILLQEKRLHGSPVAARVVRSRSL